MGSDGDWRDDQTRAFSTGEADAWFRRNRDATVTATSPDTAFIADVLAPFREQIHSILEIGCSDGQKLGLMADLFDAEAHGIDPSRAAIETGRTRLRASERNPVHLAVGTADRLPFETGAFDVVQFGFCLYVVARERLFTSCAEADRVLRNGGFLTILDFDPPAMQKRPYHHREGVFSFKARYDEFFTRTGHYHLVAKRSFSHDSNGFSIDPGERVAITVLFKEHDPYVLSGLSGDT